MGKSAAASATSAAASAANKGHRSARSRRPPLRDPPLNGRLPPPESRRNIRPRRRRLSVAGDEEDSEEEEERGRRKLKLVLNLHKVPATGIARKPDPVSEAARAEHSGSSGGEISDADPGSSGSFSSYADEDAVKPPKKRRINGYDDGCVASGGSGHREVQNKNTPSRSKGSASGVSLNPRKETPLPERKTLESILHKLQKKDIYGAFAQPVDPDELPDYHDLIEHPMDFGTVRKKLASNVYRSFEQFEDDVFLICGNAMHYNAPDTIYFRQARSIQDMARKKFQILRADNKCIESELKSEEKINLIPDEKMSPQKAVNRVVKEPVRSDVSSGPTLMSSGVTCTALNRVRVDAVEKPAIPNGLVDAKSSLAENKSEKKLVVENSSLGETKSEKSGLINGNSSIPESKSDEDCLIDGNSFPGESESEKADEFSVKCSPSKVTQKPFIVDENRRATYNECREEDPTIECDSLFDVCESDTKLLVDVGLHAEYSYARSLARFAASLGSTGWSIASKEIERVLPPGVKFGPGWVGEYEPLPTPILSLENHSQRSKITSNVGESKERPKSTQNHGSNKGYSNAPDQVRSKITSNVGESKERPKSTQNHGFNKGYSNAPDQVRVVTASQRIERHSEAQKPDFSGIPTESQQRQQRQRNQLAFDFTKADNVPSLENHSQQYRIASKVDESKERPKATQNPNFNNGYSNASNQVRAETASRRIEHHSEAQKPDFSGIPIESQQRQWQMNQLAFDFTKTDNVLSLENHSQQSKLTSEIAESSEKLKSNQNSDFNKGYRNASDQVRVETASRRIDSHSEAHKSDLFGIPIESQQRHITTMLQRQRNQPAFGFTKADNNLMDQCNSSSASVNPIETAQQKSGFISEALKQELLNVYDGTQPTISHMMLQQQRNQRPKLEPETHKQGWLGASSKNRQRISNSTSQHPTGQLAVDFSKACNNVADEFRASVTPISGNDTLGSTVGGPSKEKAAGTSVDFRPPGLGLPVKISSQTSNPNPGFYTTKQAKPPFPPPRRDDPSASAAARAWMSYGSLPGVQIGSGSLHNFNFQGPTLVPMSQCLPSPLVTDEPQLQNRGLVFYPQLVSADFSRFQGRPQWQGLVPHSQPKQKDMLPPDLNIGFQPPGSPARPSSGILIDSQQPDLALQL